ncbi:MAG TPA: hypothetical protein VM846_20120, partial [Vicinamibacterales bacterium]|nr:hypothetical protein [Vicinamibacterales bacterium]
AAVQLPAQPLGEAVTVTVPVPPLAPNDSLPDSAKLVHAAADADCCVTVTVCPATVNVPVRAALPL